MSVSLGTPVFVFYSHVLFYTHVIVCICFWVSSSQSFMVASKCWSRQKTPQLLFHATSQHLISCDEHDADDESNGKGAYQAFAHTSLLDLLRRAGAWGKGSRKRHKEKQNELKVHWIGYYLMVQRHLIVISKWKAHHKIIQLQEHKWRGVHTAKKICFHTCMLHNCI